MEYILNKSPLRTTNNFGINDIKLDLDIKETSFNDYDISCNDLIINKSIKENFNSRIGLESNKYLDLSIKPKKEINEELVINYNFDDTNSYLCSSITIDLDYDTNVILCFRSTTKAILNLKVIVKSKTNIRSNISIVNLLNKESDVFVSIENEVLEDSLIETKYFDLNGEVRVSNYYSEINGKNGSSIFKTIYLGKENERLDMNYYTLNNAVSSNSNMLYLGALFDKSNKSLKGTIDFISGAKKSKGEENENCLLFSNDAVSKSLPMLLCTEEDVEGAHGMSSGKIDKEKLFYLMSRGINEKDAIKLVLMSNFRPIIDSISNDSIKEEIINNIMDKIN